MKKHLQSPNVLLLVIVLTLLNNVDHAAFIYMKVTRDNFIYDWANEAYAIFVVIVIELAILQFVVHNRKVEAAIYAGAIFFINLLYFDGLKLIDYLTICQVAATIFSLMFSYSIYVFTELYMKVINTSPEGELDPKQYEVLISQLKEEIEVLRGKLSRKKTI